MSWAWILLLIPFGLFAATLWTGLGLLRHRREPSLFGYLVHGIRFFNPLWFKPEARARQRRFVVLFALFMLSIPAMAAVAALLAATG